MKKTITALLAIAILTLSAFLAVSQDKVINPVLQKAPKPQYQVIPSENFGLRPLSIDLNHIDVRTLSIEKLAVLPASFDLRTQEKVTPVKNQGLCKTGWAFAATGSLESRVLVQDPITSYDFSEQNIVACAPNSLGTTCDAGGNIWLAANLLSLEGARQEADDTYTCPDIACGTPVCNSGLPIVKNLTGMRLVCNTPDTAVIKDAIYNYGAVYAEMYASFPGFFSYDGNSVLCYTGPENTNHAVLIVGWNDTMDAGTCGTGAWIVKNSWGTGWGKNGYFYIAYGSAKIGTGAAYLEYKDYDQYEKIYYYDDYGMSGSAGCTAETVWAAVRFTPAEDGNIRIVDFWAVDDDMTYSISIYDDWISSAPANLLHSQDGSLAEPGFYSISLTTPVAVTTGDEFVVVMKFVASGYNYPTPVDDNDPIETNKSYISCNGSSWIDVGAGSDYGWDIGIRARNVTNQCPVANDQAVATIKDTSLGITLVATDGDDDTLIYSILTSPANGSLSGTAPNLIYSPNAGYIGTDNFTFKANDGTCDSNTATINIAICSSTPGTYYRDADGDGYGDPGTTAQDCSLPSGYVTDSTDCDDTDNTVYPGAPELCDGKDNNCDGATDEGVSFTTFYRDADGDGYGNSSITTQACSAPWGYVAAGNDCNDTDAGINPGVIEICDDGVDNNCNGTTDEGCGPDGEEIVVGYGKYTADGGRIRVFDAAADYSILASVNMGWEAYNTADGQTRPALGDVDGDGKDEIVVGYGGAGGGWIGVFDDADAGYSFLASVNVGWQAYNAADGQTRPACGDVDGDGKDEIVVGYGTFTANGGTIKIFDDADANYAQLAWENVGWTDYNAADGQTRPALGDVDGDGKDEIVVGYGGAGNGWVRVFDDAAAGYASLRWIRAGWQEYRAANGETRPACGDIDGDGYDEIVVGFGTYTANGGLIRVFDDAAASYASIGWIKAGWGFYDAVDGQTRPACGDVDGDGKDEIVVGYGSAGDGWIGVFDDAVSNYASLAWKNVGWDDYNTANGETWPAAGNIKYENDGESNGDDDGNGRGCFIATAVYGTPLAKEVRILSRFRDTYLLPNYLGQKLVSVYYKLSPPVAEYIKGNAHLKATVRSILKPVVWLVEKFFTEEENQP